MSDSARFSYGVEGFVPHMLERSPFFAPTWEEANASLVVLLVPSQQEWMPINKQRLCLERLQKRSESYRATRGRRHFFLLPHGRGPCCGNGLYTEIGFLEHHIIHYGERVPTRATDARLLLAMRRAGKYNTEFNDWPGLRGSLGVSHGPTGPNLPCFDELKDVSIPPPHSRQLLQFQEWKRAASAKEGAGGGATAYWTEGQSAPPFAPSRDRPHLLFLGARHDESASWHFSQQTPWKSACFKALMRHSAGPSGLLAPANLTLEEGLRSSRFCAICGGFARAAPWTPRLAEALREGCVPVFIERDHWVPPWQSMIDYSKFSVTIPLAELVSEPPSPANIERRLVEGIRPGVLQRNGQRVRWAFEYNLNERGLGPRQRDMLPLLVLSMGQLTSKGIPKPEQKLRLISRKGSRFSGAVNTFAVDGQTWSCFTRGRPSARCTCSKLSANASDPLAAKRAAERTWAVKVKAKRLRMQTSQMCVLCVAAVRQKEQPTPVCPQAPRWFVNGSYGGGNASDLAEDGAIGGWRWLVAYGHASNGLGNRLAGIRTAFALAQESRRRF
jgi:hypothetical protein